MIESPLTTKTLFTVGPVPITEPVVVTWGIMAALALAGWLVTPIAEAQAVAQARPPSS